MGADVAAAKAAGMPFGFSEFNTTTLTGRAAWLTSVGAYILASGASTATSTTPARTAASAARVRSYLATCRRRIAWKVAVADRHGDTEPPSAARRARPGAQSTTTRSTLSWTASTDNVAVAGYSVYRNGSWAGSSATASFTDSGLSRATTYHYSVYAYDEAGNTSADSGPASVTTLDTAPPSVPTNPAVFVAITQLRLSWTVSTDSAGTVAGYYIYCDGRRVGGTGASNFLSTQLRQGTTYDYTITAFDTAGNVSGQSVGLGRQRRHCPAGRCGASARRRRSVRTRPPSGWRSSSTG